MNRLHRLVAVAMCAAQFYAALSQPMAQQVAPSLYGDMRWRMIGPHRGGRAKAAAGIPSQPNVFYIGVVNGGVWKTTDYGRVWTPIFDDQPTGSIGAIAIAPSNPDVIYVGSGEGLQRPICPPATAYRNQPTQDRRGRTSVSATASRSRK